MAFNGRFLLNMIDFAQQQGAKADQLIKLTGSTYEELSKEETVVSNEVYNLVVEKAVEWSQDSYFGLHAAESMNLAAAGLIGQITHSSTTVKEALEYCCEFAKLGCSSLPMNLEKVTDAYKLTLTPEPIWAAQSDLALLQTVEGVIAFTIKEFHSLTRMKHYPLRIEFPWSSTRSIEELERVFGCAVYFNKEEIAIYLNTAHVEEEVLTSNYDLLRVLVTHAEEKMAGLTKTEGYANLVKQSILKLVKPEFPTIEQVASHLNVSLRTLQRRLKEEGHIYKQIINELRKEMALAYLKKRELSISEIAYLLSYSDNSSFTRAFKNWTGKTPNEFRIELF